MNKKYIQIYHISVVKSTCHTILYSNNTRVLFHISAERAGEEVSIEFWFIQLIAIFLHHLLNPQLSPNMRWLVAVEGR